MFFIMCYLNDEIKKDEMGEVYNTHGNVRNAFKMAWREETIRKT
jgi:hypothetical protein